MPLYVLRAVELNLGLAAPITAGCMIISGQLVNIFKSDTFGDIDTTKIKLTELFCEERSGFIWVCLNPDIRYNLDEWMEWI